MLLQVVVAAEVDTSAEPSELKMLSPCFAAQLCTFVSITTSSNHWVFKENIFSLFSVVGALDEYSS